MMKIFETYQNEILRNFWGSLHEVLEINESETTLPDLLNKANELIFQKFKINPKDKVYFICGSARLYLYPELRELFKLTSTIGDLDIVIPDKKIWLNAGLENEWNNNGIYRPSNDVEVFNIWAPQRAGEAYADTKVRPTKSILSDSTFINGYYYMPFQDIIDYKVKLSREKEQDIVNLIMQYQNKNVFGRGEFIKRIIQIIGLNQTKNLFDMVKKI